MRLRDPIRPLLAARDIALTFAVRSELQESHERADSLWDLPAVRRLLRRQQRDGSWRYPSRASRIRAAEDYDQLETYDTLLELVERYRLDVRHPAIPRAADFLFSFQTEEGDLRGIYGNQYTPNYTAAILAVLIDAGYRSDRRVDRGLRWLLAMRQDDGGWAIPLRTGGPLTFNAAMRIHGAIAPDRARPSSHLVTGIVLRALAAHPRFRRRAETKRAAALLATRFFTPDPIPIEKQRATGPSSRSHFDGPTSSQRWTPSASRGAARRIPMSRMRSPGLRGIRAAMAYGALDIRRRKILSSTIG